MRRDRIANGAAAAITLALLAGLAIPELPKQEKSLPDYCWGDLSGAKAPVALFENEPGPNRMERLRGRLIDCGWDPATVFVEEIQLPSPLTGACIGDIAEDVRDRIDQIRAATGADRVDAVGYSLQAMTLRYDLAVLGGTANVRRVVLWGSPNNGSDKIAESPLCYFNQLAKSHPFIPCLNGETPNAPDCDNPYTTATPQGITQADPADAGTLYVNYYSDEDLLIMPGEGVLLDRAYNIEVPLVPHGQYPDDEGVLNSTIAALTGVIVEPPKNDPSAFCGALSAGGSAGAGAFVLLSFTVLGIAAFARSARP
ncbi:MAG: hypothetical protein KC466_05370 [Myxococcales bacterium]|nr:hypothetical protein [Myxococcales bacterium]